jgi:hypothetical protein
MNDELREAVGRFLDEADSVAGRRGLGPETFDEIGRGLMLLAARQDVLDERSVTGLHDSSAGATIIGRHANGSMLMLARFGAEAPTPVHNHNSWGVACVLKGRDRYQRWSRLDDGADPDRAEVRLVEELTLEAGDVVWIDPPPQDLHAQQGIAEAAWELVYFGRDALTAARAYFDPATGAVTYGPAMR